MATTPATTPLPPLYHPPVPTTPQTPQRGGTPQVGWKPNRLSPTLFRNPTKSLIDLSQPHKAKHPDTGKPVTLVGIDLTSAFGPKFVAIVSAEHGITVELLEYADELTR